MGDTDNAVPPSKKRAAGREISKDNPGLDDEEDITEQDTGTFKRASDEVLASRRIVKVRRNPTTSTTSSNPFTGIRLVPSTGPTAVPAAATSVEVATSEKSPEHGKNDSRIEIGNSNDENNMQFEGKTNDQSMTGTTTDKESAADKENFNMVNEGTDSKMNNEKPAEDDKGMNGKPVEDDKNENEKPAEDDENEHEKTAEDDENENEKAAEENTAENVEAAGTDKTEGEDKKDNSNENANTSCEGTHLSSFQQLSSNQNAFTGLAGTGFSTSTFAFGSILKDESVSGAGTGPLFGKKSDQPSFGFGQSINGSSSLFSTSGSSLISKNEGSGFPAMQEVPVETGEEDERVAFSADSVLFEYVDGAWKERGKGEVKVNVSTTGTDIARLIMRARGNYRLILNARLYPDMKLTNMDKRGITFACINSIKEGKDGLLTFALKFKDGSIVEEFRAAITEHKSKTATVLKNPENSPKASDES